MIDSISFCINANSGSAAALRLCLKHLQQQNVPDMEILVYGQGDDHPPIRYLESTSISTNASNQIRNLLCRQATKSYIALIHVNAQLPSDWFSQIRQDDFAEILGTRLTGPRGRRIVDWSYSFQTGDRLLILPLDYDEWTPQAFVSGEVILFQKKVWDNVKFEETRTAHDGLIDFCLRATKLGYRLGISRARATVKGNATHATEDQIVVDYTKSLKIYKKFRRAGMHDREPNLLDRFFAKLFSK